MYHMKEQTEAQEQEKVTGLEASETSVFFLTEEDHYDGKQPYFYDPSQYPWVKTIEDNWETIREEFAPIIEGLDNIESTSVNPPNLSSPDAWKNIYFFNFGWKKHENCKRFPKTYELLRSIPNLTFAEFTALEPNSSVLPHIGETNTTIRGHLGLKIPGKLPEAGIKVGDQQQSWEEGKLVLFSDAHRHTVWNHTNGRRFVLVFDVIRDEYSHKKWWICAKALGALTIKYFDEKVPFFKKLPSPLMTASHYFFSALWYIYLPFQRRFDMS